MPRSLSLPADNIVFLSENVRHNARIAAAKMQDSVGKFVEISFPWGDAEVAPAVVSKDIAFDDHAWTVHCYPRGAPEEPGAGAHLSIHFVNHSNARNAKVILEAVVLRRADASDVAAIAPATNNFHASSVFEYPSEGSRRFPWPRVATARDLHEDCAVGGYVTVVCGLMVLRHNPISAPPSTFASDLGGLVEARRKFGDPDASFSVGGRTFDVVRNVLAARSPVLTAELDGATATTVDDVATGVDTDTTTTVQEEESAGGTVEETVPVPVVVRPRHEFNASTFCAVLLYIYCDRLPRDNECGCPVTMDLVRDLLAAAEWYKLERLKLLCARWLWSGLSVATVCRTLWCADRYKCPRLRSLCIDFLTAGDNIQKAYTYDFDWLILKSPSVNDEIKRRLDNKQNNVAGAGGRDGDCEEKRIKRRLEAQNADEKRIKRRLEMQDGRDNEEEKSGGSSSRVVSGKTGLGI
ncbi:hypothetical protein HU200_035954 [Digitaria exilis]|uniref:BTB domain-containing protein n=1 Tax=Digitaria exilis TaxID=1010633 RepID=A0A835EMI6_9POAL|nr:hypothetical protein HU200_035954 [Digitaria exilis]